VTPAGDVAARPTRLAASWAGQRFCALSRGWSGNLASVVIARGVSTADGDVPTILLKVPCEVSVVEDGDRRVAVTQLSPRGARSHSSSSVRREEVRWITSKLSSARRD
jgi:hypothetical protein